MRYKIYSKKHIESVQSIIDAYKSITSNDVINSKNCTDIRTKKYFLYTGKYDCPACTTATEDAISKKKPKSSACDFCIIKNESPDKLMCVSQRSYYLLYLAIPKSTKAQEVVKLFHQRAQQLETYIKKVSKRKLQWISILTQ